MSDEKKEILSNFIQNADTIIKWCFALNGAAAAGLLTFIGNSIDKKDKFVSWDTFGDSLMCFIVGLILAVACNFFKMMVLNYFSQLHEPGDDLLLTKIYLTTMDRGIYFGIGSLIFFILSMVAFIAGVYLGKTAIFG